MYLTIIGAKLAIHTKLKILLGNKSNNKIKKNKK